MLPLLHNSQNEEHHPMLREITNDVWRKEMMIIMKSYLEVDQVEVIVRTRHWSAWMQHFTSLCYLVDGNRTNIAC